MAQIFLSYAREDEARVRPLVAALEGRGWTVFWDRRIPVGQTWRAYIGRGLEDAKCVIVAWSRDATRSRWVTEEADEGQKRGILIPVLLDPIEPPIGFRSLQAADLSNWVPHQHSAAFEQLLCDIGTLIDNNIPTEGRSVGHPRSPHPAALQSISRAGSKTFIAAVPLVAALLAGGLLLYRYLTVPASAPLRPTPSEKAATHSKIAPSDHTLVPMAGAFDESRWSKLVDSTVVSGGHRFIAGELQIFTHRGPVLVVARETSTDRDISYSVKASVVSGPTQLGYGLVFGVRDARNYFRFAKRNSGDYQVMEVREGRRLVLVPWTSSQVIKGIQHSQTLEIATEGPFVTLIVDGKTLERVKLPRPPVGRVGLAVASPGLTVNFSHVVFGPRR